LSIGLTEENLAALRNSIPTKPRLPFRLPSSSEGEATKHLDKSKKVQACKVAAAAAPNLHQGALLDEARSRISPATTSFEQGIVGLWSAATATVSAAVSAASLPADTDKLHSLSHSFSRHVADTAAAAANKTQSLTKQIVDRPLSLPQTKCGHFAPSQVPMESPKRRSGSKECNQGENTIAWKGSVKRGSQPIHWIPTKALTSKH